MPENMVPGEPPSRRQVLRAATVGAGLALGSGLLGRIPADAAAQATPASASVPAGAAAPAAGTYDVVVVGAGAGSTIGPAMTFGYVAANDIADQLGA